MFERLLLGRVGRVGRCDVARTRDLARPVPLAPSGPRGRHAHRSAGASAQPGCHRPTVPPLTRGRGTRQRGPPLISERLRAGEERVRTGTRARALSEEPFLPLVVPAARDRPDPVRRVARHLGHLIPQVPLRQPPDDRPVAPLHPRARAAVAPLQLRHTPVRCQRDPSRHTPLRQESGLIWYYCFYPWERFTTEPAETVLDWEGAGCPIRYSTASGQNRQSGGRQGLKPESA